MPACWPHGPPPRTWGILAHLLHGQPRTRSTPTHVGNTALASVNSRRITVHPHARGEYGEVEIDGLLRHGPPPRTWGIRDVKEKWRVAIRSTPTHVGNTCGLAASSGGFPVHPHARGEYDNEEVGIRFAHGPPPRTWGILAVAVVPAPTMRSTPTHVGNTSHDHNPDAPGPVHPHARGEYSGTANR